MAYDDDWERELLAEFHRWSLVRNRREWRERRLTPDERLDDVGWEIFYCATLKGMDPDRAAAHALDGVFRQRCRVRDDLWKRLAAAMRQRSHELRPLAAGRPSAYDTQAPEQIAFWERRLTQPSYVYFIQSGADGPIKIGLTNKPTRRVPELQTGNPRELLLRHVIPGDMAVEKQLHVRFEPARIRGEWFGREYLPVILSFAGGLADEMIWAYDGSGRAPILRGAQLRTAAEIQRIRRDIDRHWSYGHIVPEIAAYLSLEEDEVRDHLVEMSKSPLYRVRYYEPGCKNPYDSYAPWR